MFKGNNQEIYFNKQKLATLTKAEAKLTCNFEEVELCGQYGTEYEYTGYTIEGTITIKKADSLVLKTMGEAVMTGEIPTVEIMGVNLQKPGGKEERVIITDARLTEVNLLNAEAKTVVEEEIPFNATSFKLMSLV